MTHDPTQRRPVRLDIPADLPGIVDHRAVTDWHDIAQASVDAFADVTGDRNPLHLDPAAVAGTPFAGTIAHGAWLLAVVPPWFGELVALTGIRFAVLTGYDQIRFPAALPVGSRVRMHLHMRAAEQTRHGARLTCDLHFESDRVKTKPVCTITGYQLAAFV